LEKILSVTKHELYEVRKVLSTFGFEAVNITPLNRETEELVNCINDSKGDSVTLDKAYNLDGFYIGDEDTAKYICETKGINPEPIKGNKVCSIGFCDKEQKWYGWSHRAIYGFGIGDKVEEGDCTNSSGWTEKYLKEHPEADKSLPVGFTANTLENAKLMAIAFAESVS
jgi:hypothetical protein